MSFSRVDERELQLLIEQAFERRISKEGMARLDHLLQSEPEARKFYFEYIQIEECLKGLLEEESMQPQLQLAQRCAAEDMSLWRELLEEERSAQAVIPETDEQEQRPAANIRPLQAPAGPRRQFSRWAVLTAATSVAAALVVIASVFIMDIHARQEVATVVDSMNAQWAGGLKTGTRLRTREKELVLKKGFAEILFDNGAKVVLEGPANIDIITPDQIQLNLGKLYSVVPPQACGFTVSLGDAKVIDLGTEFGLEVASSGTVELHVLDGKTVLVAGQGRRKSSQEVIGDQARAIDPATGQVYETACKERHFARDINSEKQLVWRGENINLGDIVGGGFARGTGVNKAGYDPDNGMLLLPEGKSMKTSTGAFHAVVENPFVDGVFSPKPDSQPAIISSTGIVFEDCPPTNGRYWRGIFKSAWADDFELPGNAADRLESALSVHPNQGITFDLQAIREQCKGRSKSISRFTGVYGISPDALKSKPKIKASLHILVDGQLRFEKIDYKPGEPAILVDVPLKSEDRFLTIVSTDGSDNNSLSCWAKIANAVLVFE